MSATFPVSLPSPFLKQIDHVAIQTEDPAALYHYFTEVFKLPPFVPLIEYPILTSASVLLGNMYLEIVRFGPMPARPLPGPIDARLYILSFVTRNLSLADSLGELDRRGIAHSGVMPFYSTGKQGEPAEKLWANVYLGDLLGTTLWMRPLFFLSKFTPDRPVQASPGSVKFVTQRVFRTGWPFLTEYYQGNDEAKHTADEAAFQQSQGGSLGIERVQEVLIGLRDYARRSQVWERFLSPLAPIEMGCWALGDGPKLRLIASEKTGMQALVLKVASLERARTFLWEKKMLAGTLEHTVIALPNVQGLEIRLVE